VTVRARRVWQVFELIRPRRRWLQVRLRTVLVAMTLLGIWLGVEVDRAHKQREVVATILELGGQVYYKHQREPNGSLNGEAPPPGPVWLRRWLGDEYFQTPYDVNIDGSGDTDACVAAAARLVGLDELTVDNMVIEDLEHSGYYQGWSDKPCPVYGKPLTDRGMESIGRMTKLTRLTIGGAAITDDGLRHLAHLSRLRDLNIIRTPITGTGLSHLACWDQLEGLGLGQTRLSDQGLENLKSLRRIRVLGANRCRITDAGLRCLGELTSLDILVLGENDIGDEGVKHLAGLVHLKSLGLCGTRINNEGLKYLHQMAELEGLDLNNTSVGDDGLNALSGLRRLTSLHLYSTRVSDIGFERLQMFPDLNYVVIADPGETEKQIAFAQRYVRFGPPIARTPVSDAAIQRLQQALPKLVVRH
jgi:hypothetical protein